MAIPVRWHVTAGCHGGGDLPKEPLLLVAGGEVAQPGGKAREVHLAGVEPERLPRSPHVGAWHNAHEEVGAWREGPDLGFAHRSVDHITGGKGVGSFRDRLEPHLVI